MVPVRVLTPPLALRPPAVPALCGRPALPGVPAWLPAPTRVDARPASLYQLLLAWLARHLGTQASLAGLRGHVLRDVLVHVLYQSSATPPALLRLLPLHGQAAPFLLLEQASKHSLAQLHLHAQGLQEVVLARTCLDRAAVRSLTLLPHLTALSLAGSTCTSEVLLAEVACCSQLVSLSIAHVTIAGAAIHLADLLVSPLAQHASLRALDVSGGRGARLVAHLLCAMPRLMHLHALAVLPGSCASSEHPPALLLPGRAACRVLSLRGSPVTLDALAAAPHVSALDLSDSMLAATGDTVAALLRHVALLGHQLKQLSLLGTRIGSRSLNDLCLRLPCLAILWIALPSRGSVRLPSSLRHLLVSTPASLSSSRDAVLRRAVSCFVARGRGLALTSLVLAARDCSEKCGACLVGEQVSCFAPGCVTEVHQQCIASQVSGSVSRCTLAS